MATKILNFLKQKAIEASKILFGVSALLGALLAIIEFWGIFYPSGPDEYNEDWIPIVYSDAKNFRSFLDRNDKKIVKINSAIALDLVVPVNYLVHQVCDMKLPDEVGRAKKEIYYSIGMPTFDENLDEDELDSAIYSERSGGLEFPAHVLEKVKCMDTLRIELLDPKSFRWSYGGTGTRSLPISGTFRVTSRAFSGPSIEYTLRQVAE